MSVLEHLPSHVTPGVLAQSSHFLNSCPVMSLLELLPRRVTPGSLPDEFLSSRGELIAHSCVNLGALAQS